MLLCTSHREARLRNPQYQAAAIHSTAVKAPPSRGQPRMHNAERYDVDDPQRGRSPESYLSPDRISFARADQCDRSLLARLRQNVTHRGASASRPRIEFQARNYGRVILKVMTPGQ